MHSELIGLFDLILFVCVCFSEVIISNSEANLVGHHDVEALP